MSKINKSTVNPRNAKKQEFNAKSYERPGLSADEVEEIKEAFDIFDADQNGTISVNELLNAMKSLGFDSKNPAIYKMIADFDADDNGVISFDEFLDMMTARISDRTAYFYLGRLIEMDATLKIFNNPQKRETEDYISGRMG